MVPNLGKEYTTSEKAQEQMGLKEWIIPQDRVFFDVLEKESANVLEGAVRLEDAVKSFDNMDERRKDFKDIEHAGDEIVHDIYEKVNRSFITPIDQEDLTKLASLYDDVLDYMYAVMNRLVLFEILGPTETMVKFTGIVRASVEQINKAFLSLRKADKAEIDNACIEVDRLENEGDVLLNEAVAALFKSEDVINILKLKEIYEHLETVTDRCEDLSFVIRDIMIKHS
jgi:predicted phosphate transport protein (TIGR00153 family)